VGSVFFPLDEELALLPGTLSPWLQEALVRLGTWLPFGQAAQALAFFTRVEVSESSVRRQTEAAGAVAVALQETEVIRLEVERPPAPTGPAVQQISADGAMVPLCGGTWAEVKTVAIGTVKTSVAPDGTCLAHAEDLSYFARLADHLTFSRWASGELHRRGTATAQTVAAVVDGSLWLQEFIDTHRPDAVRILDFPHALEHLNAAAQAAFGEGTPAAVAWLSAQAHVLKTGEPDVVLAALAALPLTLAAEPAAVIAASLAYLRSRREQITYAQFQAQGLPIGSGIVESANKLLVEARLKGAGMHWARPHVNPMLALRAIVANDRWSESWPPIARYLRTRPRTQPARRCAPRGLSAAQAARPLVHKRPPSPPPVRAPTVSPRAPTIIDGRPTQDHPWKKHATLTAQRIRQALTRSAKS
jgi:hypothetical protein